MAATKDQVAQLVVAEAKARGHSRDECLAELSCLYQESQLDETIWGPAGKRITFGVAQQDGSYPNRFNGAAAQVAAFFDRLDIKRASPGRGDIWLNLFWIQQGPNWPSAQYGYDHGRKAYLNEIKSRIATVTPYLDKYWPITGGAPMPVSGDPAWIPDVVAPVLGNRFRMLGGALGAGHGDFKDIRGVMWHHTGNARERAESIRNGRPDLPGPLANFHIAPDGIVTFVAVGVCWHAGVGSYPWLPTNMANWHMIGVECAWPFNTSLGPATAYQERWPDAQFESMLDLAAVLTRHLGVGSDRDIGHKDYAGRAQGKWDPGNWDTKQFQWWTRERIDIISGRGLPAPAPVVEVPTSPPANPPLPAPDNTAHVLIHLGMSGLLVTKLQTRLQRNYSRLVVDGVFGPATEAAVRDYQRLHPPLDPDGVVGPQTAAQLGLVI